MRSHFSILPLSLYQKFSRKHQFCQHYIQLLDARRVHFVPNWKVGFTPLNYWVPATPAKYIFVCTLFMPRHNALIPDPHLATPFMSSILCFTVGCIERMCLINMYLEGLPFRFLISAVFPEFLSVYDRKHSIE